MIQLPGNSNAFEHENNFYLSCATSRLGKFAAHYELSKMVRTIPGAIVECGVFKGASFIRFAGFRSLFKMWATHKMIGFDSFGAFPETAYIRDRKYRRAFIKNAGAESISKNQLLKVLAQKNDDRNVELIAGDIVRTVPAYIKKHPRLKISFLHIDTDIYEPSVVALKCFVPLLVKNGILVLDDYGNFPGETKAADEYFKDKNIIIKRLPFATNPSYIVREGW